MRFTTATQTDTDEIVNLVQDTINAVYPKYYPQEVVDFFCELHCLENVSKDVAAGAVGILRADHRIVGTGCHEGNHVTRVYVRPEYQGQGYGSYIMQCLEDTIKENHASVLLDASLPACIWYEHRGYRTIEHKRWDVKNGAVLIYEIMEKRF